jgi:hypothetical protein
VPAGQLRHPLPACVNGNVSALPTAERSCSPPVWRPYFTSSPGSRTSREASVKVHLDGVIMRISAKP